MGPQTHSVPTNGASGRLAAKPDWPRAQKHWLAFWDRQNADRPLVDVRAPSGAELSPLPEPNEPEERYFDPEFVARQWLRTIQTTYFGGEAVPTGGFLMGGYALGCGPQVGFAPDTVWHPRLARTLDEPVPWRPGANDPWTRKMEEVLRRLLDEAEGRFLVGYVIQVPANDLLMLLRGTEDFLLDLARNLETCQQRLTELFEKWWRLFQHFRSIVDRRQEGCVWSWPGLWHKELVMATQSDMSCMISARHFEDYVMHELDELGERCERVWYHLDGPLARRHLPALLSRPYIKAIQYVPGDGQPPNGPAYLEFYRQVQAAGRCLDIAVPPNNVEFLVRRLRPEGLMIRTQAPEPERAEELIGDVQRWCGARLNASA